ncbi:hypothetical protein J7400_20915 [Shimia sp. R9_2]|uniref:ABC-three component system protein n=1 Tax=Shimia sp. R9_2 TaxID=2821112 RepID=UPI001ADD4E95|nr:ABC-three component system protein [Shimia sp. R9_2]MBO9399145.1 hypothetical protein [Shimia sp. R9_2]
MFTTASVSEQSFLRAFLSIAYVATKPKTEEFAAAMNVSTSKVIGEVKEEYLELLEEERADFLDRITIFDASPRITEIADLLSDRLLRTVRREYRSAVMERLEGWWNDITIRQISGEKTEAIYGAEVSDKLAAIAEEYRSDNLPITFRKKKPEGISPETDDRMFVRQLRSIGTSTERIQSAIIDYYRAFEQRSSWAREDLLVQDEMEDYEDRLVEEWGRYKSLIFEALREDSPEEKLVAAGKELFKWVEFETGNLRIRERVAEPFVVRGAFHILANARPKPKVHWHPRFLERIEGILETTN